MGETEVRVTKWDKVFSEILDDRGVDGPIAKLLQINKEQLMCLSNTFAIYGIMNAELIKAKTELAKAEAASKSAKEAAEKEKTPEGEPTKARAKKVARIRESELVEVSRPSAGKSLGCSPRRFVESRA